MAQRQVTTVLEMLAQRQAVQAHTQVQVQTQAQAQVQVQTQVQARTQHNPYQSTAQPLTFAELAARQNATAPVASDKVQELLVRQQQAEQEQVVQQQQVAQTQTVQPPAYAVNPYLDPDVEMPPPEPFDISSLDYADHPPINPLAGAQHASKVNDPVYDQVYL